LNLRPPKEDFSKFYRDIRTKELRQLSERSTCERINFEYLVHNSASVACWYQMPSTQVRAWRPCLRVLRWRDEIGLQIGAMISRIQRNGAAMERACTR